MTTEIPAGFEGPNSLYIKLVSSDGYEFIIKREFAFTSEAIRAQLSKSEHVAATKENTLDFQDFSSHTLEKICTYFQYKEFYTYTTGEIPEFPIDAAEALDFFVALDYFDSYCNEFDN